MSYSGFQWKCTGASRSSTFKGLSTSAVLGIPGKYLYS